MLCFISILHSRKISAAIFEQTELLPYIQKLNFQCRVWLLRRGKWLGTFHEVFLKILQVFQRVSFHKTLDTKKNVNLRLIAIIFGDEKKKMTKSFSIDQNMSLAFIFSHTNKIIGLKIMRMTKEMHKSSPDECLLSP